MSFVGRRLLQLIPVAVGVTIIAFFMIHLIPGAPARITLGLHAPPQPIPQRHKQGGLDRPLISQYWLFLDRLLHLNLGQSLIYGGTVARLIWSHLPPALWPVVFA